MKLKLSQLKKRIKQLSIYYILFSCLIPTGQVCLADTACREGFPVALIGIHFNREEGSSAILRFTRGKKSEDVYLSGEKINSELRLESIERTSVTVRSLSKNELCTLYLNAKFNREIDSNGVAVKDLLERKQHYGNAIDLTHETLNSVGKLPDAVYINTYGDKLFRDSALLGLHEELQNASPVASLIVAGENRNAQSQGSFFIDIGLPIGSRVTRLDNQDINTIEQVKKILKNIGDKVFAVEYTNQQKIKFKKYIAIQTPSIRKPLLSAK